MSNTHFRGNLCIWPCKWIFGPMALSSTNRQEQIVEAARALFVRRGYRHSSMEDIAAGAGISRRTLYLHFESKDAIFNAMLEACEQQVQARARQAELSRGPIVERVADLLYAYYGTGLEWFEDAQHLREIETLVIANPLTFGPHHVCEELVTRVSAMVKRAAREGQGGVRSTDIESNAQVSVFATIGAASVHDASPANFRERVNTIAKVISAVLA
jgi:AcrR family transcriptional regulator